MSRYTRDFFVFILTAHSMEEAEVLCDRLGIFVDGGFQCIGNAKEVTYLFTAMKHITTFCVAVILY
jgi:ABC-type multidrug transport system ATPase subunit